MALIAAIVVVTNTGLVSVTQRTHEIGIRRALGGLTRRPVISETLAKSAMVGLLGGSIGLGAGAGLLAVASKVSGTSLPLSQTTAIVSLGAAILSGVLAGWYPARRAASIDVVTAWGKSNGVASHPLGPSIGEPASLAFDSLRTSRARSFLAIGGIVIDIVTVVLVASVLANVRNQIALFFRDLGTENVFAFPPDWRTYVTQARPKRAGNRSSSTSFRS